MSDLSQINIYFGISDPLNSEIVRTSKEIKDIYNTRWTIDNESSFPHLSLHFLALPTENLPKALELADEMLPDFEQVEVKVKDLILGHGGFILLTFEKSKKLYQYHLKVLEAFNKLRDGAQRKKYTDQNYLKVLSGKNRKYIDDYGYYHILDQFESHITLTVVDTPKIAELIIKKYKSKFIGNKASLNTFQIMLDDYETSQSKELIFKKGLL